jgi:hypothetical protein
MFARFTSKPAIRPIASDTHSSAAVLSKAGAPLSWTKERAASVRRQSGFHTAGCEQLRKAAANWRQPQRAERAMYERCEPTRFSSASDDKVGGLPGAIRARDVRAADLQAKPSGWQRAIRAERCSRRRSAGEADETSREQI